MLRAVEDRMDRKGYFLSPSIVDDFSLDDDGTLRDSTRGAEEGD
jgi:hypothetical protein